MKQPKLVYKTNGDLIIQQKLARKHDAVSPGLYLLHHLMNLSGTDKKQLVVRQLVLVKINKMFPRALQTSKMV